MKTPLLPAGARRNFPAWAVRLALVAGLALLGLRAGLASLAFMQPGGAILGWSELPKTHCAFCNVRLPAGTDTGTGMPNNTHVQTLTPEQYAAILTQQLSLDDALGQMIMVQVMGPDLSPDAIQMINAQGAGGVIFYGDNIQSAPQIQSLTSQLQHIASIPLLLSIDQEGGTVNRFYNLVGPLPSAAALASPDQARQRGQQDAVLLHQYGFNLNLAPVVDVGTSNPQLWSRTFGSSPDRVAAMAGAYLDGLQQSGLVTGCLKHYPGLGATTTDPHLGMPVLDRSRADWEAIDLAPYRTLLKSADVRAIMVTHEMIPAVDQNLPSTLSPAILDGTLRQELGYQGVVITDSLYMGALNVHWSVAQAGVLAVVAGADILIGPYNPQMVQDMKDALRGALDSGTLSRARINTSVQRILTLKLRMGLIPMPHPRVPSQQQPTGLAPVASAASAAVLPERRPAGRSTVGA